MTFEEKYAAYGKKLDELKAKLDTAVDARKLAREKNREQIAADIDALVAEIDEFDAALDKQIDKQYDTLDAQIVKQCKTLDAEIGKQYDTMERRVTMLDAQINKQCDTIDAQVEKQFDTMAERVGKVDAQIIKQCNTIDAQVEKQFDTMAERVDKLDEQIEEYSEKAKAAFTLDKATAEAVANEPTRIDAIEKGTAEQAAKAKGDVVMAEENARLIRERCEAKCTNARLRSEVKVKAAKEKIAERKEAHDKAAQEEWIFDLLEYAEGCYETAVAWALEAEYTLMEADYEIDYYKERFGSEK